MKIVVGILSILHVFSKNLCDFNESSLIVNEFQTPRPDWQQLLDHLESVKKINLDCKLCFVSYLNCVDNCQTLEKVNECGTSFNCLTY